jgi:hypothetical protein
MHYAEMSVYHELQDIYDKEVRGRQANGQPIEPMRWLAAGWLDPQHGIPQGACPPDLVTRLRELCIAPAVLTGGYHECGFCVPAARPSTACGHSEWYCQEGHKLGSGQVFLTDSQDQRLQYVLPDMAIHYVEAHGYCPPTPVLKAIQAAQPFIQDWLPM